jgi:hypothetical protein
MVIKTLDDNSCVMNYKGIDGAVFEITAKNHIIDLNYTDKDGNKFVFASNGESFTIPSLYFDTELNKLLVTVANVDASSSS